MDYRSLLIFFRFKICHTPILKESNKRLFKLSPRMYPLRALPGTFTLSKSNNNLPVVADTTLFSSNISLSSPFLQSFFSFVLSSEQSFLFFFLQSFFFFKLTKNFSVPFLFNIVASLSFFSSSSSNFKFFKHPTFLPIFSEKLLNLQNKVIITLPVSQKDNLMPNLSITPQILKKFWFFFLLSN